MPPSFSIVIPTFNGGSLFADLLAALSVQRYAGQVDLHIIDSGSSDDTLDRAAATRAHITRIKQSDFNHGLTRNRGIAESTGDLILLLTQDAVPADEFLLEKLAANFSDPAVAGVFARQIPRPEHDVLVQRSIRNWVAGSRQRREIQLTDRAEFDRLPPMEKFLRCVFDNVCSAVRRAAWQQVPFRANDFGEDIDWSKRALEAGWKIVFEPAAAVIHSHERPARYEYRRTYQCHRKLYELFGLQTVPSRYHFCRSLIAGIAADLRYVLHHETDPQRRLALAARVPSLVCGSVLGQYRGARDERRKTALVHRDV